MDQIEHDIHRYLAHVMGQRFQLENERTERRKRMALELKGLKSNMRKLQSTVEELNSMAIATNEKGDMLKSHLGDIKAQIGEHVDDIEFTATVLGNSSGELEKPPAKTAVPPVSLQPGSAASIEPGH